MYVVKNSSKFAILMNAVDARSEEEKGKKNSEHLPIESLFVVFGNGVENLATSWL